MTTHTKKMPRFTHKSHQPSRRSFLKSSLAISATSLASTLTSTPTVFATPRYKRAADLPKAKGLRCIVIGGGWAGLTIAKYLRAQNPLFDVVLIEKNSVFNSTIFANPWLVNAVDTDFTQFSYINAAKNNGYIYMQATVIDVNKTQRTVYTDKGALQYEYLIVAPGLDYDYQTFGLDDKTQHYTLKQNFPAGYQNASELITLKNKIQDFVGGDFVITVPKGNYRCLTGPYERACLVADYFKKEKIDGRIILLDQNEKPRIMAKPFLNAFNTVYKDQISYHTNTVFKKLDPINKAIECNHGAFSFEDASIYPPIRAARLLKDIGLIDQNSDQKEANINPQTYRAKKSKDIFVIGDARPQPFSKCAYTAYSEARFVAKVINADFLEEDIPWESPCTISYTMMSTAPSKGLKFSARYTTPDKGKSWTIAGAQFSGKPSSDISAERLKWGKHLYTDMIEG